MSSGTENPPNVDELRQKINDTWVELNDVQNGERPVNTISAAASLLLAMKALDQTTSDRVKAQYWYTRARYDLVKAQEAAKHSLLGYLAILIEFLYLGLTVGLLVSVISTGIPLAALASITIFQVPVFVIVWGFLGGVAWCLYGAADWSNQRLFDAHYFPWYLAHPWISAVLGAAVALLIIGGLSALGTFDLTTVGSVAVLSVTSFVAGFSTHEFWKLLDRTVTKLLGGKEPGPESLVEAEKLIQQPQSAPATAGGTK